MDGPGGYCAKWTSSHRMGFPSGTSGKESYCQCRRHKRHGFNPWVGKIPWSRKWQPTSVFLPGEFHGQRSLAGYSPWGHKESDMTEHTSTQSQDKCRMIPLCWKSSHRRRWYSSGCQGLEGGGDELFSGYKVSVLLDESLLEICSRTKYLWLMMQNCALQNTAIKRIDFTISILTTHTKGTQGNSGRWWIHLLSYLGDGIRCLYMSKVKWKSLSCVQFFAIQWPI